MYVWMIRIHERKSIKSPAITRLRARIPITRLQREIATSFVRAPGLSFCQRISEKPLENQDHRRT